MCWFATTCATRCGKRWNTNNKTTTASSSSPPTTWLSPSAHKKYQTEWKITCQKNIIQRSSTKWTTSSHLNTFDTSLPISSISPNPSQENSSLECFSLSLSFSASTKTSVISPLCRSASCHVRTRNTIHNIPHPWDKGQIVASCAVQKCEFHHHGENQHSFREDKNWYDRVESGKGLLLAWNTLHQEEKEELLISIWLIWLIKSRQHQRRTTFLLCFSRINTRLLIFYKEGYSFILRRFTFESSCLSSSLSSLCCYGKDKLFLLKLD